jgi:ABC-type polysaccharide/polyol phosphate export permease
MVASLTFRDIIQVITTWLTVLFYVTPVMWKPVVLPHQYHSIIVFNPSAQFSRDASPRGGALAGAAPTGHIAGRAINAIRTWLCPMFSGAR